MFLEIFWSRKIRLYLLVSNIASYHSTTSATVLVERRAEDDY